ncbi:MAG: ABC transporter substrate-binding protein [Burkholderiaceae bacterium]
MRRRSLIGGASAVALGGVLGLTRAQPLAPAMARVGVLSFGTSPTGANPDPQTGFRQGLRDLGHIEGRNVVLEYRYADGRPERLPAFADELLRAGVQVIVAGGPAPIEAARAATKTVPIVAIGGVDPVRQGWVKSLAHPGGNLTGVTVTFPEMGGKLLEVLKEARPGLQRVGVLGAVDEIGSPLPSQAWVESARALGLEMHWLAVKSHADLEPALSRAAQQGVQGLMAIATNLIVSSRQHLAALARQHRLPTISEFSIMTQAGFLMSYGANLDALGARAASYVDKILRGASPGDLPIERPSEFELVINRRTEAALGITLPQAMLLRADRLIE